MEFTVLTEEPRLALPTILTPERMRVALRLTVRTEVEVWARHIIRTPGPMRLRRQGSSPYGSWGQSVVSNGNRSAYTQHYSNANGTVATAQGSRGGAAAASSTKYGSSAVAKTSSGNMYASHDGNVYKNTGNGWSSYDNGNWNSINSSRNAQEQRQNYQSAGGNQASAEQRAQSSQRSYQSAENRSSGVGDVDREFQNQSRGEFQSQRFDSFQREGGGWGGGERGFGGGGGFGGGRSFGGGFGGRRR